MSSTTLLIQSFCFGMFRPGKRRMTEKRTSNGLLFKTSLLIFLSWGISSAVHATEYYVTPTGTAAGNGSSANPWDLQTALNQPASVKPGDTIWVRGGVHRLSNRPTKFVSRLSGASGLPITVRAYPGERATIDGNLQQTVGGWVTYWGLEVMDSQQFGAGITPTRTTSQSGPWPTTWWATYDGKQQDFCVSGVDMQAPNCKLINMVIHDNVGGGLGVNAAAGNMEMYGTLSYYNGWQSTADRGHGHGIYGQNAAPTTKRILDCLVFDNFAIGMQATGAGPNPVADNFDVEGSAFFLNGALALSHQNNLLIGAFQGQAQNPIVRTNFIYDTMGSSSDFFLGYDGGSMNAICQGNYFQTSAMFGGNVNMTLSGNTFVSGTIGITQSSYPNNNYLTTKPTQNVVAVRPNKYEPGRANIVIYNWQKLNAVAVDVSNVLPTGTAYEVRNAQDFYGIPVTTGTYNGGTISVPMTGFTVAKPVGIGAPPTSGPDFAALVLLPTTSVTPPSNTAPTVSSIPNQTVNAGTPTAAIGFTVSDAQTAAGSLTVSGSSSNPTLVPNANIVFGGSGSSRTVTVTPAANQSGTATITVSVSDGTTSTSTTFALTVNAAANTPPTISTIAAQTTTINASAGPIAFTVSDTQTAAASLTVSGSSSNPTLVPNANIVFGGSGSSRTVTVTPAANQSGTANITVTVNDGSVTASTTFTLTVNAPANTPPTISAISAQTVTTNSSTGPITFTVSDAQTAAASLTVSGSSSNPTLVPNANIVFGGSGSSRTVMVTPAANQSGTANITVTVNDGSATASSTFALTVNASTTPPTQKVYLTLEAAAATLTTPMTVVTNAGQRYVVTTTAEQGSVTFTVNITVAGTYVMWGRVLSPSYASDSLYVSVDGGTEDIYDDAEGKWSSNWQWTVVNGRGGTSTPATLNPRTFVLSPGTHTIKFRGREANTTLSRILVTNDLTYVPKDTKKGITLVVSSSGAVQGQLQGSPSTSYEIQSSTNMVTWSTIATNTADADGIISFTDANGKNGSKYYRLKP